MYGTAEGHLEVSYPEWMEEDFSDPSAGGFGEDEFVPSCPVCFDPIDYCLGHGEMG